MTETAVNPRQALEELVSMMEDPLENEVQNVTGVIYGDNGSGKTVLALKLAQAIVDWKGYNPSAGPEIIMLDAVNAWRSLKNHPELQRGNIKRIPYVGKSQIDTLNAALQWKQPPFNNVKVVIFDELSAMADFDEDVVVAARVAADTTRKKDPDVSTQPDMGATTTRMRRTMIATLKKEVSVIMVCHVRNDEDKNVGYKVTRPRLMPKFSGTIREGLDFVGLLWATEGVDKDGNPNYRRQIRLHPTNTEVAKSRIGGLRVVEDPDIFVRGVIRWLNNEVGDNTNYIPDVNIQPDVAVSDSIDDDYAGVTVD